MDTALILPLITQAILIGVIAGFILIPRLVFTSLKDNWGKMPDDIDKTYLTVLKIAGLSICPVWLFALVISLLPLFDSSDFRLILGVYAALPDMLLGMAGIMVLYIVGLKYDLHGTSSFVRLLAIILASTLFAFLCEPFPFRNLYGLFGINMLPVWLAGLLMLLVSSYLIEMVKLLDGMNGLASGTLTITLLLLLWLCIRGGNIVPTIIIGSAFGVILTFWLMKMFSKKWRKVIMGNSGSYVMGFVLAYAFFSSFTCKDYALAGDNLVIAFSVVMLPALDMLRVIGSRARDSRSIITPDRNQINFKLLRTGMPNGAVFPVYILLMAFFPAFAMLLLSTGMSHGMVIIIEVVLWIVTELVMNHFIHDREKRTQRTKWNRVYGRDAWNANIPYTQIQAKQLHFGTMRLPQQFINGDELEFISDGMSKAETFGKRLFDIIISIVCLILFSPVFLLCYILVKADDGKQVIFRQERIGRFGRPFNIYKFRTMHIDAEETSPQLSHAGGEDDPRLTKTGRFLRAHHLDELPQLWNVLCGDMTLIGYRPERKFYIDQIMEHDPRYAFLYQIRPGITSYATLYNGYTDTMEKMLRRLELDLYYLAHRSWWFDCKILFLTFVSIVFGKKF